MKKLILIIACLISIAATGQEKNRLRVASYNLRVNIPSDGVNAWPNRKDNVKALIEYHDFDIVGTQEGLPDQLRDLAEMPDYSYFGNGRDDGIEKGEHSAIFYKTDRFTLLDSGNFWLSETPDVPSFGWDAQTYKRVCSWVKLRDKIMKKNIYVFNVHFDHVAVVARRESGKLMVQKITEIAGDAPVICTGDFNSTPDTEQIKTMQAFLSDSYHATKMLPYGPVGTFNAFQFNAQLKERIDYVFVSNQFNVLKYAVLTDYKDQRYPSDHMPVVVDLELVKR